MREYCYRIPICELYKIFKDLKDIKEIINTSSELLTDSQMIFRIIQKLDAITDIIKSDHHIDTEGSFLLFKKISTSPTGKFQAWLIDDKIIIFSEDVVWCVYQDALFRESELLVSEIVWNEDEPSVLLTLFNIVYGEYKSYKTMLLANNEELCLDIRISFTDMVDKHFIKREKDNYIIIKMPFGSFFLCVYRTYSAPMRMFFRGIDKEKEALKFYLYNNRGPLVEVKNINIQTAYVLREHSKLEPLLKGERTFLDIEESIVDGEGKTLVRFDNPDVWVLEEYLEKGWE